MSASRYSKKTFIQPIRKIAPSQLDIMYTMKAFDTIDNLAAEHYKDPNLSWIIMCANPDYFMEFDIKPGDIIRIPMPLENIWKQLGEKGEI